MLRLKRFARRIFALSIVLCAGRISAAPPSSPTPPSQAAEPGLSYGLDPKIPAAKTIMFSMGPDEIIADAEEWAKRGVSAFFLDNIAGEWSTDIWGADGKPWTIGESDESIQKCRKANEICKRIGSETYLKLHYSHFLEWFSETAWQRIENNFRQFAIFARDAGCAGIAIDIEYVGEQYSFDWPGYDYKGYTREQLISKIRERMTKVLSVMYDEFPDMVFLTLPEEGFSLGSVIHVAWIEEAARRAAPGGIHYCIESTYRSTNIRYMFAYAWAYNEFFQKLLSKRGREYWVAKCSIAEGLWPFGFDPPRLLDPGLSLDEYRQGVAGSMMVSRRYNWIFGNVARELMIGRKLDKYHGKADIPAYLDVLKNREVVTTPKYVKLAARLRDLELDEYSADLGLVPVPYFSPPAEFPIISLVPKEQCNLKDVQSHWELAFKYYAGAEVDNRAHFGTQTRWMLIGPFANEEPFKGHNTVYPPEKKIDLDAEYDGLKGKIRWNEHNPQSTKATVDLTKVFTPTEHVCAYALSYVTSPVERKLQIRVGTNDAGKVWFGKKLILDFPVEGMAFLDRDVIPVTVRKGTTPILIKVSNKKVNWGFVFRMTEADGRIADGLEFSARPPR